MLLEDTLVVGDPGALQELFEDWAVLAGAAGSPEVRGGREITRFLARTVGRYLADPGTVIQARNRALVTNGRRANVVRRGRDGAWRYEILHLWTEREVERRA